MLTEEATTMPGFRVTKPMIKVLIMCLFAFVTYGLGGVGVILLMVFFSYLRIGKDDPNKHGISSIRSSRLGGVAVLFVAAMYIFGLWAFSPYTPGVIREPINMYMWISLFFATLLGFCDDIRPDFLSPRLRMAFKFLIFGTFLWFWPQIIPTAVGIPLIDDVLGVPFLAWCLVTVFVVAFINAINMSDGANGLVPGIGLAFFTIMFFEYGRPIEGVFLFALTMFLIFNVISGWFFLGDTGSYALGGMIVMLGLRSISDGDFSVWFMVALVAYPCLDFAMSLVRRLIAGKSPFVADSEHFHNRLHGYLIGRVKSKVLANSLTGLLVSGFSAGVVVCNYLLGILAPSDNGLMVIFFAEASVYVFCFWLLGRVAVAR